MLKTSIINIANIITNDVLNIQLYIPTEPALIIKGIIPKVLITIRSNKLILSKDILLYKTCRNPTTVP